MAQIAGGLVGVMLVVTVVGQAFTDSPVKYVATIPGSSGLGVAFLAELVISFGLMMVVLVSTNIQRLARFTGLFAGILVAIYIILVAPLSGMSMNPARTFASALPGRLWAALWVYFAAPPLGMLLAAEGYLRLQAAPRVICAKLHHHNEKRCIFHCGYKEKRYAIGDGRSLSLISGL